MKTQGEKDKKSILRIKRKRLKNLYVHDWCFTAKAQRKKSQSAQSFVLLRAFTAKSQRENRKVCKVLCFCVLAV